MSANPSLPVTYVNRLASETGLDGILIVTPAFFEQAEDAAAFVADLIAHGALSAPLAAASQAEMEAGLSTTLLTMSPLRVKQAIQALAPAPDLSAYAPKASPIFTGTPAGPTASAGTNTTQLATTAYVRGEIAALVASSPGALDTLSELAAALGNDANFASTMTTALGNKAAKGANTDITSLADGTQVARYDANNYVAITANATGQSIYDIQGTDPAFKMRFNGVEVFRWVANTLAMFGEYTSYSCGSGSYFEDERIRYHLGGYGVTGLSDGGAAGTIGIWAAGVKVGHATSAGVQLLRVPTAPTADPGTNTTQLATTAFVTAAVAAGGSGNTLRIDAFTAYSAAQRLVALKNLLGSNSAPGASQVLATDNTNGVVKLGSNVVAIPGMALFGSSSGQAFGTRDIRNMFNSVVLTANVASTPGTPGETAFSITLEDGKYLNIEYVTPSGNSTWAFEYDDNSNLDNGSATPVVGNQLADFVAAINSTCGGAVIATEDSGNGRIVLTTSSSGSGNYFNIWGTVIDAVAYGNGGTDGDPGFSGISQATLFTIPAGSHFKLTGVAVNGNGTGVSTSGVEVGIYKDGLFYSMLSLGAGHTNGNTSVFGWPGNTEFALTGEYLSIGTISTGTAATIVARYIGGADNSVTDASVTVQALGQMLNGFIQ